MKNIHILGATGMLGSMMARVIPKARVVTREMLDAENPKYDWYKDGDWVINCIGKIKPYCDDVPQAIKVNALFPHTLPPTTIQIATDCVYDGSKGNYLESDLHDAVDVYGKTKSLGEAEHLKNLRCSIIGPEVKNHISLLDWFLKQQSVSGFTNHSWNGVTTYHFAKICKGIIDNNIQLPIIQHIVPADTVTKAELLRIIAKAYKKKINVADMEAPIKVDRTLATKNRKMNQRLWEAAGYLTPPTIERMVEELAELK